MDDNWEIVVQDPRSEEEILHDCWRSLPFQIPFDEFKQQMLELKTKHQRSRITNISLYILKTLWHMSGYASTLWSIFCTTQYRDTIIALIFYISSR